MKVVFGKWFLMKQVLDETSAETDGQLFVALTEGESFDIVMSAGGDHGIESWRKLHGRWNPYTAGRARSLLREILLREQSCLH